MAVVFVPVVVVVVVGVVVEFAVAFAAVVVVVVASEIVGAAKTQKYSQVSSSLDLNSVVPMK